MISINPVENCFEKRPSCSIYRIVPTDEDDRMANIRVCEPDDADRKKKTLKNKIKVSKASHNDSKPNISYPTNFEHTVHVGFDAITGEFTYKSSDAD
ncbi:conserved hypothetical protein [Culex quinquefasciatus]|uniref:CRIB domain-containing protein n=1 Tax=Culex quinquefasciatus TaxID=7176 RepID=B0X7S3_CULQU|nr:conserved hypothetical protein [Culex quinquefasciatus]|eukprot:XP_001865695.1 conserved hypothetical protein [Culex quinquefasciatus]